MIIMKKLQINQVRGHRVSGAAEHTQWVPTTLADVVVLCIAQVGRCTARRIVVPLDGVRSSSTSPSW